MKRKRFALVIIFVMSLMIFFTSCLRNLQTGISWNGDIKIIDFGLDYVTIQWNKPVGTYTGYKIYRGSPGPNGVDGTLIETIHDKNVTQYTFKNLDPNTEYHFAISAFDRGGGSNSHDISFKISELELPLNDVNFKNAIIEKVGHNPLNINDALSIKQLDLSDRGIKDITGIRFFKNLESLKLGHNFPVTKTLNNNDIIKFNESVSKGFTWDNRNLVQDITEIASLTNLKFLDLSYNLVQDISPLSNLTSLESLKIPNNPILSLDPLNNLKNLKYLDVSNLGISSIDFVSNFNVLHELIAMDNEIDRIDILKTATITTRVNLIYNYLDLDSTNTNDYTVIKDLEDLGIEVEYLPQKVPVLPMAPYDLTVTDATDRYIQIEWIDNSNNEKGFNIYRVKTDANDNSTPEFSATPTAVLPPNTTIYKDLYVSPLYKYYYKVTAFNDKGESKSTNEIHKITPRPLPVPPSELKVLEVKTNSVKLSFKDNSTYETWFKLYRKSDGDFELVAQLSGHDGIGVIEYTDTSVLPYTQYTYKVTSGNEIGESAPSAPITVTTLKPIPQKPTNLTAVQVEADFVKLSWKDNAQYEDGFYVYRSEGDNTNYKKIATLGVDAHSYTDNTVKASTNYYYKVNAFNGTGESAFSNELNIKTKRLTVTFEDKNFEQLIREIINKPEGEIYVDEVTNIKVLHGENRNIESINGIQYLYNLEELYLGTKVATSVTEETKTRKIEITKDITTQNRITDISYLSKLDKLRIIDLNGNLINDLTPLSKLSNLIYLNVSYNIIETLNGIEGLSNLKYLYAGHNKIETIEELKELTHLTYIDLWGNHIKDITPLQYVENIETLLLDHNVISDIGALVNNSGIGQDDFVNVANNYLDITEGSKDMQDIQTLRNRGVEIYYRPQNEMTKPIAPSNLTAVEITKDYVKLSWEDNSDDEEGFRVFKNDTIIATLSINTTEYTDNNVAEGETYSYKVSAFNEKGDAFSETIQINIPVPNHAPELEPIGNQTVVVNETLTITVTATDIDNDKLTYSVENKPESAAFDVNTHVFQWTPESTGTYEVTFKVSDGELEDSETITITVKEFEDTVVNFPDPVLEQVIRDAINKPTGDIHASELLEITSLHYDGYNKPDDEKISNLEGIQYCKNLQGIDFSNNKISDIKYLSNLLNLTTLYLNDNKISDISPISNLSNLKILWLAMAENIDINYLKNLKNLEELFLENCKISDISVLSNLVNLKKLWLGVNQISDISPLSNLLKLEHLSIEGNNVSNLSTLKNLINLKSFVIYGNYSEIIDFTPISYLVNLESLRLEGVGINDISILSNLTNLKSLNLHGNNISDISVLSNLTNLSSLWLSVNSLEDISSLSNLTNLNYLSLQYNQITDISPLVENPGLGSGDTVSIQYNDLDLSEGSDDMQNIQILLDRGVNLIYEPQNNN